MCVGISSFIFQTRSKSNDGWSASSIDSQCGILFRKKKIYIVRVILGRRRNNLLEKLFAEMFLLNFFFAEKWEFLLKKLQSWISGMKFRHEIQAWSSGMKFRHEIQTWSSGIKFRHEVQTWSSGIKFRHDVHAWSSGMKFRHEVQALSSCMKFRYKVQTCISGRKFRHEVLV